MGMNRYKEDKGGSTSVQTQRVVDYQNKVNASMEMNTPFYPFPPGKGIPGHLLWGREENV